jgi:hypothetical protein
VGPNGRWAQIVAIDGKDIWGFHIRGSKDKQTLSEAEVRSLLVQFAGFEFPYEFIACVNWERKEMIADHYASKRVFLAGDAVHLLSPSGTLGMNTGNGDATNLSWKLEALLNGWGGANLLASYEAERRPIGVRNITAATERFFTGEPKRPGAAILEHSAEGDAVRAAVGKDLGKGDVYPSSEGLQIGFRYDDSPICASEDAPPPPLSLTNYIPSTYPGARAPDGLLAGRPILDRFGRGFVVVAHRSTPGTDKFLSVANALGVPCSFVEIDTPELRELYEHRLTLVRPDGHVSWRGNELPADPGEVLNCSRGSPA